MIEHVQAGRDRGAPVGGAHLAVARPHQMIRALKNVGVGANQRIFGLGCYPVDLAGFHTDDGLSIVGLLGGLAVLLLGLRALLPFRFVAFLGLSAIDVFNATIDVGVPALP